MIRSQGGNRLGVIFGRGPRGNRQWNDEMAIRRQRQMVAQAPARRGQRHRGLVRGGFSPERGELKKNLERPERRSSWKRQTKGGRVRKTWLPSQRRRRRDRWVPAAGEVLLPPVHSAAGRRSMAHGAVVVSNSSPAPCELVARTANLRRPVTPARSGQGEPCPRAREVGSSRTVRAAGRATMVCVGTRDLFFFATRSPVEGGHQCISVLSLSLISVVSCFAARQASAGITYEKGFV